jgi:DNA segregation ATPase FtsK/SpoIIIE-like protein
MTEGLKVPLISHFGLIHFDLYDEASWHLLVGGAARTGKTVLLRLLVSSILEGMKGKVQIHISTTKASDFYMFQNINLTDDVNETIQMLNDILLEAKRRKDLLKSKGNVIDLKHFREVYPDEPMEPIILIIDEYARLADMEEIQNVVMELIETYSYVDVHIILATQRPDATTVLKPRIKANIIARLGLTTADENNSKLIIGSEDCAHLGGIKGRAILLDGIMETVQVPYINPKQCETIARRYKSNGTQLERQTNHQLSESIQSLESQSIGDPDLL